MVVVGRSNSYSGASSGTVARPLCWEEAPARPLLLVRDPAQGVVSWLEVVRVVDGGVGRQSGDPRLVVLPCIAGMASCGWQPGWETRDTQPLQVCRCILQLWLAKKNYTRQKQWLSNLRWLHIVRCTYPCAPGHSPRQAPGAPRNGFVPFCASSFERVTAVGGTMPLPAAANGVTRAMWLAPHAGARHHRS